MANASTSITAARGGQMVVPPLKTQEFTEA